MATAPRIRCQWTFSRTTIHQATAFNRNNDPEQSVVSDGAREEQVLAATQLRIPALPTGIGIE